MTVLAMIVGSSGPTLTPDERAFLRDASPWGYIVFRRNVVDRAQLRALVDDVRACLGRDDAPVLVDQEGGRVQRLRAPEWPAYPASRALAALCPADPLLRAALARLHARLLAHDLDEVGITVNCLPVLDVAGRGMHDVIGDRSYGSDPDEVIRLGRATSEGLLAGGVLPVMKHVPGHGRAGADSHHDLPRVAASLAELEARDFRPFHALSDLPCAMTAHVVYEAIDPERPGTTSPVVIGDVIRRRIGFQGLLFTDDLSMNALAGSLDERAAAAFSAGCDVGLHCNGELSEMRAVASVAPPLDGERAVRAEQALRRRPRVPEPFDPRDALARLERELGAVAVA